MRFPNRFTTFMAVLAATLVLAQGAHAQVGSTPKIDVTDVTVPSAPIVPELENPAFKVRFSYQLDNQLYDLAGQVNSVAAIKMQFQCPSYVVITGPSTVLLSISAAPPQAAFNGEGNFNVAIKRTAPGLEQIQCSVTVQSDPVVNPFIAGSTASQRPFSVSADYYGLLQAKVATKLKQAGPQKQVPFELELTNFGNARTQVNFEILNSPGGKKWNALLPDVIILESPNSGQGATTQTATFTVATPFKNGWNNEEGAYTLSIKPEAADNPEKKGSELTANVLVRVRGVYVPGFEPVALLGAVAAAAMLARRRTDDEE